MRRLRVWINYQPQIYSEIFNEALHSSGLAEVVPHSPTDFNPASDITDHDRIDLILLSLDNMGQPEKLWATEILKNCRMVAFSPNGEYGLLRMPGKTYWEEVRPFGLEQIIKLLSSE